MTTLRWVLVFFMIASGLRLHAETAATQALPASDAAQLKQEIETLKGQVKALQDKKLLCSDGKSVQGPKNKWSPWSLCPEGSVATGLARVDIQGDHEVPTNHVNDFQCGPQGCRAWCIGNPCEVIARCCR